MQSWPSERAVVVATIDPFNGNNATTLSDAVDMSKFHEAMFILLCGSIDQTVDFKLQEAATAGGSYSDISGKAITQFSASKDNKQAIICVKSEELSAGKQFVKASVTVGNGTTSLIALVGLGIRPRFGPASDDKLADVDQIIL